MSDIPFPRPINAAVRGWRYERNWWKEESMSGDFSVKITVRNGRLLRAIRAQYGTTAEMCRKCNISHTSVAALLTMKKSPVTASGDWGKAAYDISSALRIEPEILWPAHIAKLKLARNEAEIDMSMDDVQDMLQPARFAAMKAIAHWAKGIPDASMRALVMHSEGATLAEIGSALGVSRERVRQRIVKAERRIRARAAQQGVTKVEHMMLPA